MSRESKEPGRQIPMSLKVNNLPDNNPKTAQGAKKAPLHLVPPVACARMADAFADGAEKYGAFNWRDKTVSSSVYYAAALRHLHDWWDGQNKAPDNGVDHRAAVMASMAILFDAESCGKLNDDRPIPRLKDAPPAIITRGEQHG